MIVWFLASKHPKQNYKRRVFGTPFLLLLYIANILVMNRNEILELYKTIKNPTKDKATIYKLLDALNIPYKKTSCGKCLNDLYNILGEELGQIENAAEASDFNGENTAKTYKYTHGRAVILNGKKYGDFSNQSDLEELYKKVGVAYVSVM